MSDEEKQEAFQNLPLAKFGARFEWIGEYMKRFDFGGPDGIRKDKDNDGLIDAAKPVQTVSDLRTAVGGFS